MTKMVTLRISEEQLARIDAVVADGSYPSRSAFLTKALERMLDEEERQRIDVAIVEGYTRLPQTQPEDVWAREATRRSVASERW
jgi:Arc/MetJ-type ribon-helix-helix transcriptional regulator